MIDIIICEDDKFHREKVEDIVKSEACNLDMNSTIKLSTNDPDEVINHLENNKNRPHIYFLDIELNAKINGIELAKVIRKYDSNGYIIFITSHAELSLLTFKYKVQAMDYILKLDNNSLRNNIRECLTEVHNEYSNLGKKEKDVISITSGNRIVKYSFDEIIFFETTGVDHKLRVHTINGQTEFYGKLKDIEAQVNSDFYKVHRSYLVNINKVKSIDKKTQTICMTNNETCIISKQYIKGLIQKCSIQY